MEPSHNRMPILLQPKPEQVRRDLDVLSDFLWEGLAPFPSGLMKVYKASTKGDSHRNDDPAMVEPEKPHCALPHLEAKLDAARGVDRRRVTPSYRSSFPSTPHCAPNPPLSPHPALQSLYIAVVYRGCPHYLAVVTILPQKTGAERQYQANY